jgi:hypothetical protein
MNDPVIEGFWRARHFRPLWQSLAPGGKPLTPFTNTPVSIGGKDLSDGALTSAEIKLWSFCPIYVFQLRSVESTVVTFLLFATRAFHDHFIFRSPTFDSPAK